jgi:hypothetical protein
LIGQIWKARKAGKMKLIHWLRKFLWGNCPYCKTEITDLSILIEAAKAEERDRIIKEILSNISIAPAYLNPNGYAVYWVNVPAIESLKEGKEGSK